jgi:hypothetical protein
MFREEKMGKNGNKFTKKFTKRLKNRKKNHSWCCAGIPRDDPIDLTSLAALMGYLSRSCALEVPKFNRKGEQNRKIKHCGFYFSQKDKFGKKDHSGELEFVKRVNPVIGYIRMRRTNMCA